MERFGEGFGYTPATLVLCRRFHTSTNHHQAAENLRERLETILIVMKNYSKPAGVVVAASGVSPVAPRHARPEILEWRDSARVGHPPGAAVTVAEKQKKFRRTFEEFCQLRE